MLSYFPLLSQTSERHKQASQHTHTALMQEELPRSIMQQRRLRVTATLPSKLSLSLSFTDQARKGAARKQATNKVQEAREGGEAIGGKEVRE